MCANLSTPHGQLTGVLLAAGFGSRAGGGKQLLPWVTPAGVVPLIAASFDAVSPVCAVMLVVLGHRRADVAGALGTRAFSPVESDPAAPLSESIRAGLRAAVATSGEQPVLLHLGDHPRVRPDTLSLLVSRALREPERAVMPEHGGRGGHPVIIPRVLAHRIIEESLPRGLRGFWAEHPDRCVRVPVRDPGVVQDLDRVVRLKG